MKRLATLIILFSIPMMNAQQMPKPSVDVSGEGMIKVIPDEATISVQVEHSGNDARSVQKQTDGTISEVLKFLKKQGIDQKDVKTQHIRLNKNYDYQTKTYSYVANQSLEIHLRNLDDYTSLMNGLLDTGINRISGIQFDASNRKALEKEARIKAVQNAKEKAELYAATLGQSIGKALHISEFEPQVSPGPMLRSAMAMEDSSGGPTMAPGEMEIRVRINVSFELL